MNEQQADPMGPASSPPENTETPFLDQVRTIERQMYRIMTTQLRLAMVQIALGLLSILAACVIAALQ